MALIGWWPLDGNTEDYTVNQNHGTVNNVTWENGKIGKAARFNNNSARITMSNVEINKSFSVGMWMKENDDSNNSRHIIWSRDSETRRNEFNIFTYINYIYFPNYDQNNVEITCYRYSKLGVNEWHHYVFIRDIPNMKLKIYRDAELWTESNIPPGTIFNDSVRELVTGHSSNWNGQLNDIRIYDHVLSQKEINDLARANVLKYNFEGDTETYFYDNSGYKRNGEANVPLIIENDYFGKAVKFTLPYQKYFNTGFGGGKSSEEPMTVSMWVKPTVIKNQMFFGTSNGNNQRLYLATYGGKWDMGIAGNAWNTSRSVHTAVINEWTFITLRMSGSRADLFVNGEYSFGINYSPYNYTHNFYLGTPSPTSSNQYEGYIDNVNIYMSSLTNDEIGQLYSVKIKIDNQGNLYANEFVEDYEVAPGLTLTQLFEDNNLITNGEIWEDSNSDTIPDDWDYQSPLGTYMTFSETGSEIININYVDGSASYWIRQLIVNDTDTFYYRVKVKTNQDSNLRLSLNGLNNAWRNTTLSAFVGNTIANEWHEFSNTQTFLSNSFMLGRYTGAPQPVGLITSYDYIKVYNLSSLVTQGYFSTIPTATQMDTWYKDYISSRPKSTGIIKTREFNEAVIDTIAYEGKSYKEIFESNNMIDTNNNYSLFTSSVNSILTKTTDSIRVDIGTANDHRIRFNQNKTVNASDQIYYRMTHETDGTGDSFYIYFPGIATSYNFLLMASYRNSTFSIIHTHANSGTGHYNFGRGAIIDIPSQGSYTKLTGDIMAINLSTTFTAIPTKAQMDTMYEKYRQLKTTDQKLRILKDMIVIDGSIKEG